MSDDTKVFSSLPPCPNGHPLRKFTNQRGSNQCDNCGRKRIKAPEPTFRCEQCDFDLCQNCVSITAQVDDLERPLLGTNVLERSLITFEEMRNRNKRFCRCVGHMVGVAFVLICAVGPSIVTSGADEAIVDILSRVKQDVDYTLRLVDRPSYCIAATQIQAGSIVSLQRCDSVPAQRRMFDLGEDGTVRIYERDDHGKHVDLCLAATPSGIFTLATCSASAEQVWNFRPSGEFELRSEKDMCMNLMNSDLKVGRLSLHPCNSLFADLFVFGGGHFLVPSIMHEIHFIAADLSREAQWCFQHVILLWFFSLVLCASYTAVIWHSDWGERFHMKWITAATVLVIIGIVAIVQCLTTLHVGLTYRDVSFTALSLGAETHLDYTLRLSAFPDYCVTSQVVKPFAVTMESCRRGDAAQQFLMKKMEGRLTVRPRSSPDLCISRNRHSPSSLPDYQAVIDTCDEKFEAFHSFMAPKSTGGSLPLMNTTDCLNLWGGDIGQGVVGFYDCGHDLDQVFLYAEGNPTVAHLLERVHLLWKTAHLANIGPSMWCSKVAGLYLIVGLVIGGLLSWVRYNFPEEDFFHKVVFGPLYSLAE